MAVKLVFLFFFCVLFFSFVSPYFVLEELNPNISDGETFVGFFEANLTSNLDISDLKIYSERRVVEFQKGIFSQGNKTFVYVVFSHEGQFRIESNKFLYYSEGKLKEGILNHSVIINSSGDSVLTISPGIVTGLTPSVNLINVGNRTLEIAVQNNSILLNKTESLNLILEPESNFFYLDIDSYKNFKIPVFYFNSSTNSSKNNSNLNESEGRSEKDEDLLFDLAKTVLVENLTSNENSSFEIVVKNLINKSIKINIDSTSPRFLFNDSLTIEPLGESVFSFLFFSEYGGIYSSNITFSSGDVEKNLGVLFYIYDNDSILLEGVVLNKSICSDVGEVCIEGEYCSEGSNLNVGGEVCCIGGVCNSYEEAENPKKNYLFGLISFLIVGVLVFIIYKRFSGAKSISKF